MYSTKAFSGKVVVITGASARLGRSLAREFASHHAAVALLARGKDGLEAAVEQVKELGGQANAYVVDVANYEGIERAAQHIEQELGAIDIWINNAMNSVFGEVRQISPDQFRRVTEVTYLGQIYSAMAVLKHMSQRNRHFCGSALAYPFAVSLLRS